MFLFRPNWAECAKQQNKQFDMNTYFVIQSNRKDKLEWVTLQFDTYDNGIGWHDEDLARAWLKMYPKRKWRIVKLTVNE